MTLSESTICFGTLTIGDTRGVVPSSLCKLDTTRLCFLATLKSVVTFPEADSLTNLAATGW